MVVVVVVGGRGGGGFDTGLTLLVRVKEHSWDRQRVHKLTLMTSYMRGQGQVGGTVGTTKSHLYIYFVKTTFLAIFQPTSSMLLKDQSTFLFDNIWEKGEAKGKYFVADHERAINNLPRTCFFPQPTILNQAKWDPRLNQIKQNIPNIRGVQNYKYALNFLAVHLSPILLTPSHNQWRFDFRVFAASKSSHKRPVTINLKMALNFSGGARG